MDSSADRLTSEASLLLDTNSHNLTGRQAVSDSTEVLVDNECAKYESWYVESTNKQQQCFQILSDLLAFEEKKK